MRSAVIALLGAGSLFVAGCGVEPGTDVSGRQSGAALPACDPVLVGGNRKCTDTPANDQPSAFVECATYPYTPDGKTWLGSVPVSGCTLDFLARPGVPYTAECVTSCDVVE